jgi:hypothetical protein
MICPICKVQFIGGAFYSTPVSGGKGCHMRECPQGHRFPEPKRLRVDSRDIEILALKGRVRELEEALKKKCL